MLTVGGRYVCGNPKSLMPVWADTGNPPGPLNYRQIDELVAFLPATNDQTYIVRDEHLLDPKKDPVTGKVLTFTGWRDPNYKPAPGATPYPDCWEDEFAAAVAAAPAQRLGERRVGSPAPRSSAAPIGGGRWHGRRRSRPRASPSTTTAVTAPAGTAVHDPFRQPGRAASRTTSRSRTRPGPASSRARSSRAPPKRDYECRRSRPGRTPSSAPSTRT